MKSNKLIALKKNNVLLYMDIIIGSAKEKCAPRKTQNKAVGTLTISSMKGKSTVIRDTGTGKNGEKPS